MKIKKVFNLKELHYFEIIFSLFFFIRPTDPTFRVEGDGKRNILLANIYKLQQWNIAMYSIDTDLIGQNERVYELMVI